MQHGVPRGSAPGSLSFLIYNDISDVVNYSNEGEFLVSADDPKMFVFGATANQED